MSAFTEWRDKAIGRAQNVAAAQVQNRLKSVTLESAYGPKIDITDPLIPGPPNPYLSMIKPKITINFEGLEPVVLMPYGDPGATKWGQVKLTGQAVGAGLGFLTLFLLARKFKR